MTKIIETKIGNLEIVPSSDTTEVMIRFSDITIFNVAYNGYIRIGYDVSDGQWKNLGDLPSDPHNFIHDVTLWRCDNYKEGSYAARKKVRTLIPELVSEYLNSDDGWNFRHLVAVRSAMTERDSNENTIEELKKQIDDLINKNAELTARINNLKGATV